MGAAMELIRLKGVGFAYPGRPAVLSGADFSLGKGERVGVFGPNGAGKSTLFMVAMGLVSAHQGEVRLFGQTMAKEKDFLPMRTRLGFCFQDPDDQLFSPTVREDVAFGPLNQGKSRDQALSLVGSTLERLGLAGFEDRVTYHLSGGEKRLVALATALALEPEALLLDEPTAGLDPDTQARLEEVLMRSRLGWAMISHDHDFLTRTCTRLVKVADGRVEAAPAA